MEDPGQIDPITLANWREMLVGWLHWSESRFQAWVNRWERMLRTNEHGWADWFYHEETLSYVLTLMVPEELAQRLANRRTRRMYNDLADLEHEELYVVIQGRPPFGTWGKPEYDWSAAKKRVEEVLSRYGATLPSPNEVSSYELRILGRNKAGF